MAKYEARFRNAEMNFRLGFITESEMEAEKECIVDDLLYEFRDVQGKVN